MRRWIQPLALATLALTSPLGADVIDTESDDSSYFSFPQFGSKSHLLIDSEQGLIIDAPVVGACPYNFIFCRDFTGKQLWTFRVEFAADFVNWTLVDGRLLALFTSCETLQNILYCIDSSNGTLQWLQVMSYDGTVSDQLPPPATTPFPPDFPPKMPPNFPPRF